jgi:hypothetical protein
VFHRRLLVAAAAAAASVLPLAARAQAPAFPSRAVTIVIPYAAGGSADALIRPMAEKLSRIWGQPVVIDNKSGANGIIATQAVMRAVPDGHTILLHMTGFIQNVSLYRKVPYDRLRLQEAGLLQSRDPTAIVAILTHLNLCAPFSLGYVYLPALAAIVAPSMLLLLVGTRCAHRLPVPVLKRTLALVLLAAAARLALAH